MPATASQCWCPPVFSCLNAEAYAFPLQMLHSVSSISGCFSNHSEGSLYLFSVIEMMLYVSDYLVVLVSFSSNQDNVSGFC